MVRCSGCQLDGGSFFDVLSGVWWCSKWLLTCWSWPKRLNLGTKYVRGCFFNHFTFCCTSWTAITFVLELLCSLRMLLGDEAIRSSLLLLLYKKSSLFYVIDYRHVCNCPAGPHTHASSFPLIYVFGIIFWSSTIFSRSWTSFLLMVELLVFHIAFHICKARVHGALYFVCLFFLWF